MVKKLPAVQKTLLQFLGREDPLEKGKAPHSSILAWRIPWMEEPGRLQCMGSHRVGHDRSDLAAAAALKTVCPTLEWVVRSVTVKVQIGRGQLKDSLLIGRW